MSEVTEVIETAAEAVEEVKEAAEASAEVVTEAVETAAEKAEEVQEAVTEKAEEAQESMADYAAELEASLNKGQPTSDPVWARFEELLTNREAIKVTIDSAVKGGVVAFVDGIRAFIPASKLSLGFVADDDLNNWVGKTVEARVITAEKDGKKLVLSSKEILREKEAAERKEAAAAVKVGMVTEGTVETLKDYGAFINLGKGVTGLLHVSQISQKRIKTPSEVLKEGETVRVKVIKTADGRISLSMKVLDESAPAPEREEKVSFKLPKSEAIGTGLGDLLKGIKLN